MEDYPSIYYFNCPHFTVGRVDQWGEHGYLLFEEKVYFYEEDRKDQCGRTCYPMAVPNFLRFAEGEQISIPEDFMALLREIES